MPKNQGNRAAGTRHSRVPAQPVTLKALAESVGLAQATVSLVINRLSAAKSIPKRTKDRIFAAAAKLHYRPNY